MAEEQARRARRRPPDERALKWQEPHGFNPLGTKITYWVRNIKMFRRKE